MDMYIGIYIYMSILFKNLFLSILQNVAIYVFTVVHGISYLLTCKCDKYASRAISPKFIGIIEHILRSIVVSTRC